MSDGCQCENCGEEQGDNEQNVDDDLDTGSSNQPSVSISTEFGDVELEGHPDDDLDELMDTAVDGVSNLLDKHGEMTESEVEAHIEMLETRFEQQKELMRLQMELNEATSYHQ